MRSAEPSTIPDGTIAHFLPNLPIKHAELGFNLTERVLDSRQSKIRSECIGCYPKVPTHVLKHIAQFPVDTQLVFVDSSKDPSSRRGQNSANGS